MSNRFRLSTDVLLLVIGALLLVLLTAALAKYSTSWQGLQESDWLGAYGFFYRCRVSGRYLRLGVDCPLYCEWHLMSAFGQRANGQLLLWANPLPTCGSQRI